MHATGNFGQLIDEAVRLTPDKPAIISDEATLSYRELDRRMNRVGRLFLEQGVRKGDRVALLFPNDYRFVEICFGLMRIGAVPLPLNMKLGTDALSYILQDSGASILVSHYTLLDKAKKMAESRPGTPIVAAGGSAAEAEAAGLLHYDTLAAAMPSELETVAVKPDDMNLLLYTSGSTGKPKGCMLTHGGQWWNADTTRRIFLLERDDRSLVSVPLYHKNAMICAVKPCLLAGASIVILPGFEPENVLAAIEKHRVTYTTGVPAMYKLLLSYAKTGVRYDTSSLKFIVCGSSEVPPELTRELQERFGVDILEAYGLTEGGPQVLVTPRFGIRKQGSSGLPMPGCRIRIVGLEDEKEVPPGEIGELHVNNPGVALGYWNLPEVTRQRFTPDGWLKTGDLARRDEDGYVYIAGRKDDMINIGGENAYPKEIESILQRHPDIEDVCVVAIRHEIKGWAPAAFIVKNKRSALTEDEVRTFFLENGPAYAHPRRVFFLDQMPLAGTGKVDRTALVKMLEQKGLR